MRTLRLQTATGEPVQDVPYLPDDKHGAFPVIVKYKGSYYDRIGIFETMAVYREALVYEVPE